MGKYDTKTVHNITCQLAARKTNTSKPVKDKDGNVITNLDGPLLNGEDTQDAPNLPPREDLDVDVQIKKDEIIKVSGESGQEKPLGRTKFPSEVLKINLENTYNVLID